MNSWPQWIGTPLNLLSWTTLVGIFSLLLRAQILNRRAANEERKVEVDAEKGIRDHYADEVSQLRATVIRQGERHRDEMIAADKHWREAVQAAEERHEECQKSRDELRKAFLLAGDESRSQIEALRDLVAGLQRVILQNSAAGVLSLGDSASPEVRAAAERVDALFPRKPTRRKRGEKTQ